jgi:hypothetical protein
MSTEIPRKMQHVGDLLKLWAIILVSVAEEAQIRGRRTPGWKTIDARVRSYKRTFDESELFGCCRALVMLFSRHF